MFGDMDAWQDDGLESVCRCSPLLEHLDLSWLTDLSSNALLTCLPRLDRMRSLLLEGLKPISDTHIALVGVSMPHLQYLTLTWCNEPTDEVPRIELEMPRVAAVAAKVVVHLDALSRSWCCVYDVSVYCRPPSTLTLHDGHGRARSFLAPFCLQAIADLVQRRGCCVLDYYGNEVEIPTARPQGPLLQRGGAAGGRNWICERWCSQCSLG